MQSDENSGHMKALERPKLVYILPVYDPAIGSHFFHIYELLELASRDLDIVLIIERAKEKPQGFPFPVYCQQRTSSVGRFFELFILLARERFRGRRYFYTHYSFFGAIASWLITRISGGRAYYWNAGMPWLYRRRVVEETVFRFILRHLILVTGTSGLAALYQTTYGLNPRNIRVLPNWINVERFRKVEKSSARKSLNIGEGAKVVLFVHHLSARKGADLLPDIAARVMREANHVIFYIVGDGPERKTLEAKIQNLGLSHAVRVMGEVPHRDISLYMRSSDVFLMPSREEGFPHVLLEAMAAGIPYVASNVGGVKEITPPRLLEHVTTLEDNAAFAAHTLSMLNISSETRQSITREEQDWVARYDLKQVLPQFISLFS